MAAFDHNQAANRNTVAATTVTTREQREEDRIRDTARDEEQVLLGHRGGTGG
jgi:hypothetical protein